MTRKRKRRSRAPAIDYRSYVFRIVSWEPSYSFALNDGPLHDGPYWEHVQLVLTAECLAPSKMAGRISTFTFLGNREEARALNQPPNSDWRPLCVGSLTVRGDRTEYLGSLPVDSLWGLVSALPSGTLQFLDMHGERLRYGSARIRSIRFEREVDPEDLAFAREQR